MGLRTSTIYLHMLLTIPLVLTFDKMLLMGYRESWALFLIRDVSLKTKSLSDCYTKPDVDFFSIVDVN